MLDRGVAKVEPDAEIELSVNESSECAAIDAGDGASTGQERGEGGNEGNVPVVLLLALPPLSRAPMETSDGTRGRFTSVGRSVVFSEFRRWIPMTRKRSTHLRIGSD